MSKKQTFKGEDYRMISRLGQVMLYVNDQDAVRDFWVEKFGFKVISEVNVAEAGFRFIEIAPNDDAGTTSLVLHNKEFIAKAEPELNLGTPSLMFATDNIEKLHSDLAAKGVKVGDIVSMPNGARAFNFPDNEDNYFAIYEG